MIPALTDGDRRLFAFLLMGNRAVRCTARDILLEQRAESPILYCDLGYGSLQGWRVTALQYPEMGGCRE